MVNNKENIIEKAYTDLAGFSNLKEHYKDAKIKDNTITINDVKEWRSKNIERKTQLKGYNSFVAQGPYYEYQADLAFFDDDYNPNYKIGVCMIDIFSKYASVVPISSKQPPDVLSGIIECFNKMGKKPKILFTDNEGSFTSNIIKSYCKENNIEQMFSNNHAQFVERFIRSFKDMIYKRVTHFKKPWDELIYPVLLIYNNKLVHSSTNYTPDNARKSINTFDVKMNLEMKAKNTRKYPNIDVNDNVKIFKKKELKFKKERWPNFSNNIYKIVGVEKSLGQTLYKLDGLNKLYLRSELLKV